MTVSAPLPAAALSLQLHGVPQLLRDGQPLPTGTRKALALALLLVLEPGLTRTQAARWLWPQVELDAARRNLRRDLFRLRQLGLQLKDGAGESLALTGVELALPAQEPVVWLDGLDPVAGPEFAAWVQACRARLARHGLAPWQGSALALAPPVPAPVGEVDLHLRRVLHDPAAAMPALQQAWQAANARGDAQTAWLLSALALLAMAADFADFRGLTDWVERFADGEQQGLQSRQGAVQQADALRLDAARVALPTLDHRIDFRAPAQRQAAARLFDALRDGLWPRGDEHALLAKVLHDFHGLEYEETHCERIAALAGPGVSQASAAWQVRWWPQVVAALAFWGHAAAAERVRQTVLQLAQDSADPRVAWGAALMEHARALGQDDAVAQDRASAQIEVLRLQVPPAWLPRGLFSQAQLLMRRGRVAAALDKIHLVQQLCADFEVPERDRGVYHELGAQALAGLGRWDEGIELLHTMRPHQAGAQGQILEGLVMALQAGRAWALELADASERSLQLVRHAKPFGWHRWLPYQPALASCVAQAALQAGVETEFVTATVHQRRLRPPVPWQADWPWRLHVRLFGPLQLQRDGVALLAPGKGARKPRELLCLLAAHAGQALDTQLVINELWPSLEAEAPRASLDMAVSRLRKWLGLAEAVQVSEGRIALDADRVWIDVGAFEPLAARVEAGDGAAWSLLLALYQGPLLDGAVLAGRLLDQRALLAQRFAQAVERCGVQHLSRGDGLTARYLAQRSLRADPLCEPLHRVLIEAQLSCGEPAEARRSYERCRELLRTRLGVAPSPATEALGRRAAS